MIITDTHMHIIPGVDDGSPSMEESITMLHISAEQGVGRVIATPHSWGIDDCGFDYMLTRFEDLKTAVKQRQIPIHLHLGCEMLVYASTVDDCIRKLDAGRYSTMCGTRYVLTEFDPGWYSQEDADYCIRKILSAGYTPIIAHVERYPLPSIECVRKMKAAGALMQINAYSIVNEIKERTRNNANALLSEQLVDFIGSDAHRLDHRPPIISDGVEAISRLYSDEYVKMVLALNPTNLLHI
ncbi:MAG: hypothetical protein IKE11_08840 [Clostridia bacterium]|nr:hypothetical protein [Clostridia bacterium]